MKFLGWYTLVLVAIGMFFSIYSVDKNDTQSKKLGAAIATILQIPILWFLIRFIKDI